VTTDSEDAVGPSVVGHRRVGEGGTLSGRMLSALADASDAGSWNRNIGGTKDAPKPVLEDQ
jgi:hypothetical protein